MTAIWDDSGSQLSAQHNLWLGKERSLKNFKMAPMAFSGVWFGSALFAYVPQKGAAYMG